MYEVPVTEKGHCTVSIFLFFIFFCHSFNVMTIRNFKCLYNTETAEEKNIKNVNFKGNRNNVLF